MGGKTSPDAPDYEAAAEEQGRSSRENIAAQTAANRPIQYTPFGFSSWSPSAIQDPSTGNWVTQWTQNIGLDPDAQAALESQQRLSAGRSSLAEGLLGRAETELGAPVGWEALDPNTLEGTGDIRNRAEEALYGRAASRLDPQWEQEQEAVESRLWNQGLRPGDEAYDAAMGNFERARTDAYDRARQQAIIGGGQEAERQFGMNLTRRQQALSEALQRRGWTLNEINAALSGQQVGMPGMPGFQRAGAAQPTQYLPAAQSQYGANLDQFNAEQLGLQGLYSGIAGVASAAAPYAFAFSDRSLKRDVVHVGRSNDGHNVYLYWKSGRVEIGVMADEVLEDAKATGEFTGKQMVDYSKIKGF